MLLLSSRATLSSGSSSSQLLCWLVGIMKGPLGCFSYLKAWTGKKGCRNGKSSSHASDELLIPSSNNYNPSDKLDFAAIKLDMGSVWAKTEPDWLSQRYVKSWFLQILGSFQILSFPEGSRWWQWPLIWNWTPARFLHPPGWLQKMIPSSKWSLMI